MVRRRAGGPPPKLWTSICRKCCMLPMSSVQSQQRKPLKFVQLVFLELLQHAKFFSDAAIHCNMFYYLLSTRRSSGDAGGEWMNAAAFAPKTGAAATDRNQQHGKMNANNLTSKLFRELM